MTPEAHEQAILAAHASGDHAVLVRLYGLAGDHAATSADINAAAFFWTYAYIYALEIGDAQAKALHAKLKAEGREE